MYNYFTVPNIPDRAAKCVIVDYRTDQETLDSLRNLGINIIPTTPVKNICKSVCGHADMMLHHLGGLYFVSAFETYDYYKSVLPGAEVIKGCKRLSLEYPEDILYNCAVIGKYAICNKTHTSNEILSAYKDKIIINVNQGYAKCSTCIIAHNAVITADKGIAIKCRENDIDVLKITPGYIDLPGMNYGFIGGATGLISNNLLAVNGELSTHPDGQNIREFCCDHGVDIVELKKKKIKDIGSIVAVW